jgi:hypothetical protein
MHLLLQDITFGLTIVGTASLAWLLITILSFWNIFVKAGKSGLLALIPLYNIVVLVEISGLPLWHALLLFVPGVNVITLIVLKYKVSKAFGHDLEFSLGLILLPFIFWPILAFGSSRYTLGAQPVDMSGASGLI